MVKYQRKKGLPRPVCNICYKNPGTRTGTYKDGQPMYARICAYCKEKKYRCLISKEKCRNCGFIPMHACQLDIDHIDGNHSNNNLDNLQVLCANCHRLKTFLNGDHLK